MRISVFILLSLLCLNGFSSGAVLSKTNWPANLKICNINLPKVEYYECIRDAIEFFITSPHDNKTSIKIPVFDPFTVNSLGLQLNYNTETFNGGNLRVKNLKNYGFGKLKVQRVKANFTDETFELLAKMFLPKIHASALYKTNFVLAGANVDAKGQFNATVKEITIKASLKGKVQEVDGENYMNIHKFDININDVKDLKLSISGLFHEPELNRIANEFLNSNWRSLRGNIVDGLKSQWEVVLLDYANGFFSQVPWNQLYEK